MIENIFNKIIRGDLPCYKIYEDDKTLAFLDIHPVQPGHILVIPKLHAEFVWDMANEDYEAVMATCKKVALRMREVLQVPFVGEQVIGIDVPHAHVHLIPFHTVEEFRRVPSMSDTPDHVVLSDMASKLAF